MLNIRSVRVLEDHWLNYSDKSINNQPKFVILFGITPVGKTYQRIQYSILQLFGDVGGIAQFLEVSCIMLVTIFASDMIKSKFVKVFNKVIVIKNNNIQNREEVDDLIVEINGWKFLIRQFLLNKVFCGFSCFKRLLEKDQ
jgi:hypothetical protein